MSESVQNQIQIQKNNIQTHEPLSYAQQLINYKGHPIKDKVEFDKLMQQSSLTFKKLQVYIVDLSTQLADKKVDPTIFRKICENIILNHQHWGNDIDAIKFDIQYLFDNFSVVISTDGIHYGDNTASKKVQFQKLIAKYPGGELQVSYFQIYFDKASFVSPFVSGLKSGIAQYTGTGAQCICACKDDKKFGFGQYKYITGSVYEGEFAADVFNGRGKYQFAKISGSPYDIYEGDFIDEKWMGKGVLKFTNGDIYEGDWKDCRMTGKGVYKYANGNIYQGDFVGNKRTGKGVLKFVNEDIYEGDFVDGKMTGKGVLKFVNGNIYEGDFANDKRTGKGVLKSANGDTYTGSWKDGARCGHGRCAFANRDVFDGVYYVDGDKLTNEGTMQYASGDVYQGWMKVYTDPVQMRKRCGKGKLVKKSGEVLEGEWENDELVQPKVE